MTDNTYNQITIENAKSAIKRGEQSVTAQFNAAGTLLHALTANGNRNDGTPTSEHSTRIADKFDGIADINERLFFKTAAYLHDLVEDFDDDLTIEILKDIGFSKRIWQTTDSMTRRVDRENPDNHERYFDFIERLSRNADARALKIEDLDDNLKTDEQGSDSRIKHQIAKDYLMAVQSGEINAGPSLRDYIQDHGLVEKYDLSDEFLRLRSKRYEPDSIDSSVGRLYHIVEGIVADSEEGKTSHDDQVIADFEAEMTHIFATEEEEPEKPAPDNS